MKILIYTFFSIIMGNILFSQNDTIYHVFISLENGTEKICYNYKFKEICIPITNDNTYLKKCNYISHIDHHCYVHFFNDEKTKKSFMKSTVNNQGFTGIASFGGMNMVTYYKMQNGLESENTTYDKNYNLIGYSKIKHGKVEEGYTTKSIIKDPYIEYYPSGGVKIKAKKKDLKYFGLYREFYENGQLKTKGRYKLRTIKLRHQVSEKTGIWKYYDENGKLIKKERF